MIPPLEGSPAYPSLPSRLYKPAVYKSGGLFTSSVNIMGDYAAVALPARGVREIRLGRMVSRHSSKTSSFTKDRLLRALQHHGPSVMGQSTADPSILSSPAIAASFAEGNLSELVPRMSAWQKLSGLAPVISSKANIQQGQSNLTWDSTLRHEQIHAAHLSQPEHPFFEEKLQATPSFNRQLRNDLTWKLNLKMQIPSFREEVLALSREHGWTARRIVEHDKTHVAQHYANTYKHMGKKDVHLAIKSERLAWGYQNDQDFLEEAARRGIRTPKSVMPELESSQAARRAFLSEQRVMTGATSAVRPGGWMGKLAQGVRRMRSL